MKDRAVENIYSFDITRLYRIWFSKNPAIFLGPENELRFVQLRNKNPKAQIFFIFSSACLNSKALSELEKFCFRHQIKPVDFDKTLPSILKTQNDKTIYEIAKKEIQHVINKSGGNLAAASDCVRMLESVIRHYGIYTDFDVQCSLGDIFETRLALKAPVLFNGEVLEHGMRFLLNPNTDFLAFSSLPEDSRKLSRESLNAIYCVQKKIIENYTKPLTSDRLLKGLKSEHFPEHPSLSFVLKEFFQTKFSESKESKIFDFRNTVAKLDFWGVGAKLSVLERFLSRFFVSQEEEEQELAALKTFLMKVSVINMSGPGIYFSLYQHLYPAGKEQPPVFFTSKDMAWRDYVKAFIDSCVMEYPDLALHVKSRNSMRFLMKQKVAPQVGEFFDASWLEEGEKNKRMRELQMHGAARRLQRFFRDRVGRGEDKLGENKSESGELKKRSCHSRAGALSFGKTV